MLKLYKGIFALYIVTAVLGFFGILTAFYLYGNNVITALISAVFWIFFSCVVFFIIANIRYNIKVLSLLNNCHIREFIAENERLLQGKPDKATRRIIINNLFVGYLEINNIEKAGYYIFQLAPGNRKSDLVFNAMLNINLASFYTITGNYPAAKQALDTAFGLLNNPAIVKSPLRQQYLKTAEDISMAYNLRQGFFDGAKTTFTIRLSTATTLINKVEYSYWLAKICEHNGEADEAAAYLRYVAENGGDSFFAAEAKEKLSNTQHI